MAKKEEPISMVDSFSEFKELKNIDKTTMISVLEESFRNVLAKMFGSDEDLKELVGKAHERGMKIVLDAVFNHCSMLCAQFRDVLQKGRASRYYDWFLIRGDKPDPEAGNYECFAACRYMPKWNTNNEEVQAFLIGVALHWMRECGVDGWRLDVADEVSHDFWRRFRKAVKAQRRGCEATSSTAS